MVKQDKLIVVSITDELAGCTMTIKASTAVNNEKVVIHAEDGVYKIEELKAAIKEAEEFYSNQVKKEEPVIDGIHLP